LCRRNFRRWLAAARLRVIASEPLKLCSVISVPVGVIFENRATASVSTRTAVVRSAQLGCPVEIPVGTLDNRSPKIGTVGAVETYQSVEGLCRRRNCRTKEEYHACRFRQANPQPWTVCGGHSFLPRIVVGIGCALLRRFVAEEPSTQAKPACVGAPAGDGYLVVAPGLERHWI
jgi:hypothetical protein